MDKNNNIRKIFSLKLRKVLDKILQNREIQEIRLRTNMPLIVISNGKEIFVTESGEETKIERMTDFMKALIPVYMICIGASEGQAVEASYYQVALLVITIIDIFCLKILLPIINIYVILVVINNLYSEDYLSKACELIKNATSFIIKGMITVVMGINVIRQMFLPINSAMGGITAKNVLSLASGMGGSANNIAQLVYGTGNLLKNAIGGAGLIVLSIIVLVPLIKIAVFIFSYQFTNAIIQPISDKKIVNCLDGITSGVILMLRMVFAVSLMFVITIAIICINNG